MKRVLQILAILVLCVAHADAVTPQLVVWAPGSASGDTFGHNAAQESILSRYSKDTGIKIVLEFVEWNSIVSSLAQGKGPDVLINATGTLTDLGMQGLMMPLDQLIQRWEDASEIPPNLYMRDARNVNTYAVPFAVRVWGGHLYNRQIFANSGFDPDAPPRYWEDLCQAAEKMTIWSGDQPTQLGFDALTWNSSMMQFLQLEGGEWIVSDDFRKVLINSSVAVKAVQVLARLYKTTYPAPNSRSERGRWRNLSSPTSGFAQGKVAMLALAGTPIHMVRYNVYNVRNYTPRINEADWGFFITSPSAQVRPRVRSSANGIGIPRSSKSPTLAWQFIKWFMSPEINDAVSSAITLHPARSDVYQWQLSRQSPNMVGWFQSLKLVEPARVLPMTPSFDYKMLDNALTQIFTGGADIASVLSEVAYVWQGQLNQAWAAL